MSSGGLAPKPGTQIFYITPDVMDYRQKDRGWHGVYLHPGELSLVNDEWWLRCPCGMIGTLDHQVILQDGKVTVQPSVVCPGGCHYFITNGAVV